MTDISATNRWIDVGLTDVLKGTYVDFKESGLVGDDLYMNSSKETPYFYDRAVFSVHLSLHAEPRKTCLTLSGLQF